MVKRSKKQKKQRRVIRLKLYEVVIEVVHHGFVHKVPVVAYASDWKEAVGKAQKVQFWKKTGLRPVEEFR